MRTAQITVLPSWGLAPRAYRQECHGTNLPVPEVAVLHGRPCTTSLAIADFFGKAHHKVMRDIRSLLAECPEEFSQSNFGLADYMDEQGKARPMYNVFFDGFILLVMGYTGPKALQLKLAYITAFNAMRDRLAAMQDNALPPAGLSQDEIVSELSAFKYKLYAGLSSDERQRLWNTIGIRLKRYLGTRDFTEIRADQFKEAKRLMSVPIGEKVSTTPRKSCKTPVENKMKSFRQQLVQAGYDADYSYTVRTDAAGAQQITHILQLTEAPV